MLALNPWGGEPKTIIDGLANATSLAVDKVGKIYVGVREPDNQVKVFDAEGKPVSTIGRKGGRASARRVEARRDGVYPKPVLRRRRQIVGGRSRWIPQAHECLGLCNGQAD